MLKPLESAAKAKVCVLFPIKTVAVFVPVTFLLKIAGIVSVALI